MAFSQISFSAFAASVCTPPVIAEAAAPVVAHGQSGDDSGECIPFAGVFRSVCTPCNELRDDFVLEQAQFGGGWQLDAPAFVPSGSHAALLFGEGRSWAYVLADAYVMSRF